MVLAYWIITVILYLIGLGLWISGGWMMAEEGAEPEEWRVWRGAILIGLVSIWAWPFIVVVAIPWVAFKWCKDAFFTLKVVKNKGFE